MAEQAAAQRPVSVSSKSPDLLSAAPSAAFHLELAAASTAPSSTSSKDLGTQPVLSRPHPIAYRSVSLDHQAALSRSHPIVFRSASLEHQAALSRSHPIVFWNASLEQTDAPSSSSTPSRELGDQAALSRSHPIVFRGASLEHRAALSGSHPVVFRSANLEQTAVIVVPGAIKGNVRSSGRAAVHLGVLSKCESREGGGFASVLGVIK